MSWEKLAKVSDIYYDVNIVLYYSWERLFIIKRTFRFDPLLAMFDSYSIRTLRALLHIVLNQECFMAHSARIWRVYPKQWETEKRLWRNTKAIPVAFPMKCLKKCADFKFLLSFPSVPRAVSKISFFQFAEDCETLPPAILIFFNFTKTMLLYAQARINGS